jgi:hypothetical protein
MGDSILSRGTSGVGAAPAAVAAVPARSREARDASGERGGALDSAGLARALQLTQLGAGADAARRSARAAQPQPQPAVTRLIQQGGQAPLGRDPAVFIPKAAAAAAAAACAGAGDGADADVAADGARLDALLAPSAVQQSVLLARLSAVRALGAFWRAADARGALRHLAALDDNAITSDFVKAGGLRGCAQGERAGL